MVQVWIKVTKPQPIGMPKQQNKEMLVRSLMWHTSMIKVLEWRKIWRRPSIGTQKLRNKAMPVRNVIWVCVMKMARDYPWIIKKQVTGIGRRLRMEIFLHSAIWVKRTTVVKVSKRTMNKPYIGLPSLQNKVLPVRNIT